VIAREVSLVKRKTFEGIFHTKQYNQQQLNSTQYDRTNCKTSFRKEFRNLPIDVRFCSACKKFPQLLAKAFLAMADNYNSANNCKLSPSLII
jgi:hypothetical protein